jgi:hypothetical protein
MTIHHEAALAPQKQLRDIMPEVFLLVVYFPKDILHSSLPSRRAAYLASHDKVLACVSTTFCRSLFKLLPRTCRLSLFMQGLRLRGMCRPQTLWCLVFPQSVCAHSCFDPASKHLQATSQRMYLSCYLLERWTGMRDAPRDQYP